MHSTLLFPCPWLRLLLLRLVQKIADMPRRPIRQLTKDGVALCLVEGPRLEAGGFQMVVGDALYMQPAPFYLAENTALHHALFIPDNAGDPLTG